MAEKELRKLSRRELLQMLLVQCEESERLQQELDEINGQFAVMSESYERLKKKLDVKDMRLNEKDARIAELGAEIEEMKTEMETLREAKPAGGAYAEAAALERINTIFEDARRAAEEYLRSVQDPNAERAAWDQPAEQERQEKKPVLVETGKITSFRKRQDNRSSQPVLINLRPTGDPEQQTREPETEFASLDPAAGELYG